MLYHVVYPENIVKKFCCIHICSEDVNFELLAGGLVKEKSFNSPAVFQTDYWRDCE